MIFIYGKSHCPYTKKVIDKLDELKLSYTKLNIADPKVSEELMAKGGKHQTPYLVDGDVAMYESDAINAYFDETYGGAHIGEDGVTIHRGKGKCGMCSTEEMG